MEKHHSPTKVKVYPKGLIYITVCTHPLKKGMMYVGSHCCNDPTYLGSGGILTHYIKKFGRQYFKRYTIVEYTNVTREQILSYEDEWLTALGVVESDLFWNQKPKSSGGNLVKDPIVHSEKTKQGMIKSGAIGKIKLSACQPKNLELCRLKLSSLTSEQRRLAIHTRSNNTSWYADICARNKEMASDPVWRQHHAQGLINRDKFIYTPEGVFKNAKDAGIVFGVSNATILKMVHGTKYPLWKFLDTKDHILKNPSEYNAEERIKLCEKYFTKLNKVAHNKIPITVQGVQYGSKSEARKVLKWSQERLENYLKKEYQND